MNTIEQKLTELYRASDTVGYEECLRKTKLIGCHVFRNSNGEHKISYNWQEVASVMGFPLTDVTKLKVEAFMNEFLR